jgi:hypothetical protein
VMSLPHKTCQSLTKRFQPRKILPNLDTIGRLYFVTTVTIT